MNPWNLSATELLTWGVVAHLIADWLAQSAWMAENKAKRRERHGRAAKAAQAEVALIAAQQRLDPKFSVDAFTTVWWDRHPAAYVHAGIHFVFLLPVFGWVAFLIALTHLVIDTRVPVAILSALMKQTPPEVQSVEVGWRFEGKPTKGGAKTRVSVRAPYFGMGQEVRIWNDQVWHLAVLAAAALLVSL